MNAGFGVRTIRVAIATSIAMLGVIGIANGAFKTKQATEDIATGESGSATATCKKGTRAVSGGFDAPGFTPDGFSGSFVQTFASQRSSKREWTSTAGNFILAEDGTLVDYAYCTDELPKLKAVSETITLDSAEVDSVEARCPKGGEAVSGGFAAPGEPFDNAFPFASRRAGKRRWVVTGYGAGAGSELTAYAYCAKDKLGLRRKLASSSTTEDEVNVSDVARCKKGQRVVSGGFASSIDTTKEAQNLFVEPFQSLREGKRGWRAGTANYTDGPTVEWDVYAYCLKKEKKR